MNSNGGQYLCYPSSARFCFQLQLVIASTISINKYAYMGFHRNPLCSRFFRGNLDYEDNMHIIKNRSSSSTVPANLPPSVLLTKLLEFYKGIVWKSESRQTNNPLQRSRQALSFPMLMCPIKDLIHIQHAQQLNLNDHFARAHEGRIAVRHHFCVYYD